MEKTLEKESRTISNKVFFSDENKGDRILVDTSLVRELTVDKDSGKEYMRWDVLFYFKVSKKGMTPINTGLDSVSIAALASHTLAFLNGQVTENFDQTCGRNGLRILRSGMVKNVVNERVIHEWGVSVQEGGTEEIKIIFTKNRLRGMCEILARLVGIAEEKLAIWKTKYESERKGY